MAVERTYRCNLCRDTLSLNPMAGKQAHGIYWNPWPAGWISKAAGQVENHLCAPCISSIQAMPAMCGQGFECTGGPKCGSDHK